MGRRACTRRTRHMMATHLTWLTCGLIFRSSDIGWPMPPAPPTTHTLAALAALVWKPAAAAVLAVRASMAVKKKKLAWIGRLVQLCLQIIVLHTSQGALRLCQTSEINTRGPLVGVYEVLQRFRPKIIP